ncbi:unknown [Rickettsia conorii str. Malish 7]|uniref:Transposase n=1 Tax=Rickettsia conorii (strain ATCC VR-613 / Malish 7) TaxID=272944 RepID=Q92GS1_RICCN|nr:unknown [Rickettsia conorii str. Malish 7]
MQDMIKLWEKFLTEFKHIIILDKEKGYIYLRSFLWYTNAKLSKQKQPELVEVLDTHLLPQDKDTRKLSLIHIEMKERCRVLR